MARHPLRERLWAALMLALYRCGPSGRCGARLPAGARRARRGAGPGAGRRAAPPRSRRARRRPGPGYARPHSPNGVAPHCVPTGARRDRDPRAGVRRPRRRDRSARRRGRQALAGERQVVLVVSGSRGSARAAWRPRWRWRRVDDGAIVLYGRCDDELTSPYRPWVEALGQYFTNAGDDVLHRLGREDAGGAARCRSLPCAIGWRMGLAAGRPGGDGDQYVLFAAVTALLTTLAEQQPVVVVLDDLHWADRRDPPAVASRRRPDQRRVDC